MSSYTTMTLTLVGCVLVASSAHIAVTALGFACVCAAIVMEVRRVQR